MNLVVRFKRLRRGARLPTKATEHSTGYDIYACLDSPMQLTQEPRAIPTGIAMQVDPGLDVQVRPRSGLGRRGVLSTFGTIDADYRGELFVTMYTTGASVAHEVRDGDRIAQLVMASLPEVSFIEVGELDSTARGEGGHGSTGR
ncbi:MAG TPA: dUTP diphosphatase [Dehalococcoidia bacterium]|nr:dUTP diphosphatase [Dehalococcoidia bacterium]